MRWYRSCSRSRLHRNAFDIRPAFGSRHHLLGSRNAAPSSLQCHRRCALSLAPIAFQNFQRSAILDHPRSVIDGRHRSRIAIAVLRHNRSPALSAAIAVTAGRAISRCEVSSPNRLKDCQGRFSRIINTISAMRKAQTVTKGSKRPGASRAGTLLSGFLCMSPVSILVASRPLKLAICNFCDPTVSRPSKSHLLNRLQLKSVGFELFHVPQCRDVLGSSRKVAIAWN